MQAVILCGGKGTRLSTLYSDRPKILVPVAGRPFGEWQMEWLARGGVTDIHLAAGHLSGVLEAWLGSRGVRISADEAAFTIRCGDRNLNITLSAETQPYGTGGGLKFVESFIRADPFFVLNGDSLMPNLDLKAMVAPHAGSDAVAILAVTRIKEAGRYGTIEFDASLRIAAFREKIDRLEGWINGGVYLMNRSLLAEFPPATPVSLEIDVFPRLARQGALRVFCAEPPLLDMGTPEGIRQMEAFLC